MNRQNFQQTGGFPLTTNTLSFAQASWLLMQELGHIGGDLTILSGCEVNGSQVTAGTVFIAGEVLPFAGGTLGANVVIQETRTEKQFEDGVARDVEIVRTAKFGNGLVTYPWSSFERLTPVKVLQKALIPVGMIAMWSGNANSVPDGWVICDGTDGTPDLENKFVRGSLSDGQNVGETGGADEITLAQVNMPPHTHSGTTQTAGYHSHGTNAWGRTSQSVRDGGGAVVADSEGTATNQGGGEHTHGFTTDSRGGLNGEAVPFDNRPQFYTLAYIMFKGE